MRLRAWTCSFIQDYTTRTSKQFQFIWDSQRETEIVTVYILKPAMKTILEKDI